MSDAPVETTWGDLAVLEYGRHLPAPSGTAGSSRVFGTNGPIGWSDAALTGGPGVIIGRKGAVRGVHFAAQRFWVIDTAFWLRPKVPFNMRWAYYQLLTQDINGLDSGSAIPSLSRSDFYALPVRLPSRADQDAIAELLGALDDKIAANLELVGRLRDLAVAAIQASRSASAHRVAQVANVRKGLSYSGIGLSSTGVPMVNLANAANYGWLKRDGFKYYTGAYKERHIAQPWSLLVTGVEQTWRHEIIGWPMLLPDDVGPALFTHHVFLIDFLPGQEWLRLPLWAHLYTGQARAPLESMVYGTTVATIPAEALTGLEFPAPSPDSPALTAARALIERAWAAERENAALVELRDAILPALVSGELRVRDVPVVHGGAA